MKNRLISVALSALMFVPALASALQYGITATGVTYPIPSVPAPYTCKTNYYVAKSGSDSNNGTSASTPWLTVSHAAAALGTARNGVCVNVGPGTYTEHVALNGITAGSDTSTGYLVFRSTTLHGALLHESGLNNVVDINNSRYIIFDGFEVTGNPDAAHASLGGIGFFESDHIKVLNNLIHDVAEGAIGGIFSDTFTVEGNVVYNAAGYTVNPGNAGSGIDFYEARTSGTPSNNTAAGTHNIIAYNVSFNNTEVDDGSAQPQAHTEGHGIMLDDFSGSQTGGAFYTYGTLVENNLVFNNGGLGINVFSGGYVTILNNTAYNNLQDPQFSYTASEIGSFSSINMTIANNIARVTKSGMYALDDDGTDTGNVWHNNLTFNGTNGNASISDPHGLITIGNGNVLGSNPLFNAPGGGDFTLQSGSPAIGKGTTTYGVPSVDLAGNVQTSPPVIGAFVPSAGGTSVPTASLSASPTSIASGQSSALTWSSTNSTSCTGTGFSTGNAVSGSVSVSPTTNTTYLVSCTGAGGTASQSATVTVTTNPSPTVTISASTASVTSGGSSILTWSSTNTTSCTASGGWSGTKATSGSQTLTSLTTAATYTLACTGAGGTETQSVTVTVTTGGLPPTPSWTWIFPNTPSVAVGGMQQFTLTGYYTDGSTQDLTAFATWDSSKTAVATISSGGLASAVGAGTATIVANYNNVWNSDVITVTAPTSDTTPPTIPTEISATSPSSSQLALTWTASTDNVGVTGYKIFRNGTQVGTSATNSYTDTGLTASTVYSYTISSYDAAGNTSAQSGVYYMITQKAGVTSPAVGSRIVTTANLNVRSTASVSGTKIGTELIGSLGTITAGPTTSGGYTWWQISYDNAITGWSVSNYLAPASALSSPTVGMAQPPSAPPIARLMQQVQQLFSQIQTLRAQTAGAGAAF